MADEWSKPVKNEFGRFETELRRGGFTDKRVELEDGDVVVEGDDLAVAPRDVVLRLLAAEASDREGLEWRVEQEPGGQAHPTIVRLLDQWCVWRYIPLGHFFCTADDTFRGDQLLAAMHGRFLLEAALREANDGTV